MGDEIDMLKGNVWDEYIKPSKIWGNVYFVGIRAVSTHLINTNEGLIIIDPGYSESLHIIVDNIWELGFKPKDIKYIVVSHAHLDHMDSVSALAAMTGAKTFIGKDDLPLLTGELYHYPIKTFKPHVLLEDGDIITLGNTSIKCVSTPGHTDGTMSFFFDATDGEKTYRAGMFGGAGSNTLRKDFMIEHNLPFSNRQKMIDSINKIKNEKIELFLGNHLENNKTEEKLSILKDSKINPFIENSQKEWDAFLEKRLELINKIIDENL
ncbi:MAG: MBL fold metallo-hydrolase [Ruminococcaceae bacterium]|nr:MBL fold metallo-hydrolase [Oscillospiraceae bacterium]